MNPTYPLGDLSLSRLQQEQRAWVAHNFPDREAYMPLLGAVEELGELSHAHLKHAQGIRGMTQEKYEELAADAVADVVIYLADYCSAVGLDLHAAVRDTWAQVKTRDWKADPDGGGMGAT